MNLNLETVNCVLLVVILALVIYCVVKQNEGFTSPGNTGDNVNNNRVEQHAWKSGDGEEEGGRHPARRRVWQYSRQSIITSLWKYG